MKRRAAFAAYAAALSALTGQAPPAGASPPPVDWALASDNGRVSNFHPDVDMAKWVAGARRLGPRGEIRDVTITKRRGGGVSARDELRKYVYGPRVSRSGLRPAK